MSEKAHVLINYDNCVATITLNRPQRGNSLTPNMVQQLIDAFEKIKDNKDIRVVVLTGSGKYFCTGMDLTPTNQSEMGDRLKDGAKLSSFSLPAFSVILIMLVSSRISTCASTQLIQNDIWYV